jgi:hypothetical protein
MKIGGVDPSELSSEEILVLPRGDKEIIFRAIGVPDYEPFNKLCPEPKAPVVYKPKEGWVPNEDEPGYQEMMKNYGQKRMSWLIITSLEPSNIEWDEVNPDNPSTWNKWEEELKAAGLNHVECRRVQNLVFEANCLDEEKLVQARESFLLGQQPVPSEFSGQSTAPENTQLGEPVSE